MGMENELCSYLKFVPRNRRALFSAKGRTLQLHAGVAAHRLLGKAETTEVEGGDGNLKENILAIVLEGRKFIKILTIPSLETCFSGGCGVRCLDGVGHALAPWLPD